MNNVLFVPGLVPVDPAEFVRFWDELYDYPREDLYDDNIGKPLTPERVRALFLWKNGGKLPGRTRASIESNFVQRIDEVSELHRATEPAEFLERFNEGGAIFRIYWLHLWQPDRYPMLDQHVYRAMRLIQTGQAREIPSHDPKKIAIYLEEYLPFLNTRFGELDSRQVDRALWACGKTMKVFGAAQLGRCWGTRGTGDEA